MDRHEIKPHYQSQLLKTSQRNSEVKWIQGARVKERVYIHQFMELWVKSMYNEAKESGRSSWKLARL